MSNRFYNFLSRLIPGSVARSSDVNAQFDALDVAITSMQAELNRAIKMPAAESATNQVIVPAAASRHGYVVGFDAAGALTVTKQWIVDWDADNKRLRNLPLAVAADEPITLGQLGAWSGALTGLPAITAQNGPLVTDGVTVAWGTRALTLLPSAPASEGTFLTYSGGTWRSVLQNQNLLVDPQGAGAFATTYNSWSSTANWGILKTDDGWNFAATGTLTTVTFDHQPSDFASVALYPGLTLVHSATIDTTGVTVGTVKILLRFLDAGYALVSDSAAVTIPNATAAARYKVSAVTPANTAYVKPVVQFVGVSTPAAGLRVRQQKLESGTASTPYSDDATIAAYLAQRSANYMGLGFSQATLTLGDTSSTAAAHYLRSKQGSTNAYDARFVCTGGTNGTNGKGALEVNAGTLAMSGPIGYTGEYDHGNSGSAKTINPLLGSKSKLTLSAATPVITISTTGLVVGNYTIKIVQDAVTARVPSFVGFVAADCLGNVMPTMTTTLGGVMFLYLYWDGSQFWVSSTNWD